ncbi:MAG: hypothetical protein ACLFSE_06825 [Spirochaetia bacterium]
MKKAESNMKPFRLWVFGCSHVGTDLKRGGRESLAEAIRQSEFGGEEGGPPFEWDAAINLGDFSGNQGFPEDDEGQEVVRQYRALRKHKREDVYDLLGNHDASGPEEETQWWFRKWLDPEGLYTPYSEVNAARRSFPIHGNWERYWFQAGNIRFLLMGDRNDSGPPVGRGERGGYPAGAVSDETFRWWKEQLYENKDGINIAAHHHMLRETTVASGPWEGFRKEKDSWIGHYHGYFPDGGPEGASYLYFVGGRPNAGDFDKFLAENSGLLSIWLGGHTHTNPDDTTGGRSHIEKKWGAWFINAASLSKYHAGKTTLPISRRLTFTPGSDKVTVECYLHTSDYAPQGWYKPAERVIDLNRPFSW